MPSSEEQVAPSELNLDQRNPRMPEVELLQDDEAIRYLVNNADLSELVQSIGLSGWIDIEPLIATRSDNVVIEGNRRLAALRVLADPTLAEKVGVAIPDGFDATMLPATVKVHYVDHRREARDFIGFKHINGAFKWDSLAKARYAWEWLKDGGELEQVSRRLGDNHSTVSRLVNGLLVLEQAEANGFDRSDIEKKSLPFSHLYTALSRPDTRRFLGISESVSDLLPENPVPGDKIERLTTLTSWLFGQKSRGERALIQSQNPDLGRLVTVLSSSVATDMLASTRNLTASFDIAEDKAKKLESLLFTLLQDSQEALKLVPSFDGRVELLGIAENIAAITRTTRDALAADLDRRKAEATSRAD